MACPNDDNNPFVQFPDAASQERHHDYHIARFYCEREMVLHKVEERASAY